jgi:hypothetical protein
MIDDTDLTSFTAGEAREYVLAFVTTLKQTMRERARLAQQLELWQRRLALARDRGEAELIQAAETKVSEMTEQQRMLLDEEREIEVKVERLKSELRHLESASSRAVDAESLLEQLKEVAGEPDTTSEKIRELEAEGELEKLKRKMQDDASDSSE